MRASRLLSILMILQARGRTSARVLADELEVSVRTIYRDVDQLSAAGVPVTAPRGVTGGFELLEGWRTRLTGLTPEETQALLVSGLPGPAAELGLGSSMASAQLKVLASLPPGFAEGATRVSARVHLDPVGWYRRRARADFLTAVAGAVWHDKRVAVAYEGWAGKTTHTLDPLGLVLKAGEWYVVARARGAVRPFRVASIRALRETGHTFERPRGFVLATCWEASRARFEASLYKAAAVIRASPAGRKALTTLSAAVADAVDGATSKPDGEGWVTLTIPIESIAHATGELLKLGPEVEVVAPKELRRHLAETLRSTLARYAGRGRRA
jgi:predicted DNA-binding transcriptional regulator YafY